jgi:hypothetical protein
VSQVSSHASEQFVEPNHRAGELKQGEIVSRGLFEAGGDGAEALQVVEEKFDMVALCVSLSVEARLSLAGRICVDDGLNFQCLQLSAYRVRVVAGIRYERLAAGVVGDDRFSDRRFVLLPRRDFDVERASLGIDEGMDFRGKPTSRTTERIAKDPPFPPAASWWARTTEASMMTPSSSASSCKALKIAAQ